MNLYSASQPLGGFSPGYYWSSSEFAVSGEWYLVLSTSGTQGSITKYYPNYVRPVRAF